MGPPMLTLAAVMSEPHSDIGRRRQREIYIAGVGGHRPAVPVAQAGLEKAAQAAMSPEAWAYVAGGAGRESTMDANRAAFEKWRIVPRVLRDVEQRDLSVELFGRRLPSPLLLSPIGVLAMVHRDADLAVAKAAAALGVPYIFSNQASVPMETCAAAMGDNPRWFQLYWSRSNELVASFVKRAEACGCSAIVLTLDTTMLGWRPRDLDLGSLPFMNGQGIAQYTSDPVFLKELKENAPGSARSTPDIKPPSNLQTIATALAQKANFPGGLLKNLSSGEPRAAVQRFMTTYSRPSLQWDDLKFLRQHTKLPIVLKGVLHPEDRARRGGRFQGPRARRDGGVSWPALCLRPGGRRPARSRGSPRQRVGRIRPHARPGRVCRREGSRSRRAAADGIGAKPRRVWTGRSGRVVLICLPTNFVNTPGRHTRQPCGTITGRPTRGSPPRVPG
jgi:lactate 2-monooxygenase